MAAAEDEGIITDNGRTQHIVNTWVSILSVRMMQHKVFPQIRTRHTSRERDLDDRAEMEVIKAILLREEYIGRVKANLDNQGSKFGRDQTAFDDLIGLVDLLRSSTVDTVEAIQQWKRVQGDPNVPFIWKSVNYVLKIPTDLNFLDDHKVNMRL